MTACICCLHLLLASSAAACLPHYLSACLPVYLSRHDEGGDDGPLGKVDKSLIVDKTPFLPASLTSLSLCPSITISLPARLPLFLALHLHTPRQAATQATSS